MHDTTMTPSLLDVSTRLALEGQHDLALELLDSANHDDETAALLLRARVLAQQGRYGEAAEVFRQVLAREPEHQAAREGLGLAEQLQQDPRRLSWRRGLKIALAGTAVLMLLLLVAFLLGRRSGSTDVLPLRRQVAEQRQQLDETQKLLLGAVAGLQRSQAEEQAASLARYTELIGSVTDAVGTIRQEAAANLAALQDGVRRLEGRLAAQGLALDATMQARLAAADQATEQRLSECDVRLRAALSEQSERWGNVSAALQNDLGAVCGLAVRQAEHQDALLQQQDRLGEQLAKGQAVSKTQLLETRTRLEGVAAQVRELQQVTAHAAQVDALSAKMEAYGSRSPASQSVLANLQVEARALALQCEGLSEQLKSGSRQERESAQVQLGSLAQQLHELAAHAADQMPARTQAQP